MYAAKARTFVSCFILCAALTNGLYAVPALGAKSVAKRTAASSVDAEVRAQVAALRDAINSGDAVKVSDFWTPGGVYTDDEGNKYTGRAALRNGLADIYLHNGKPHVDLVVQRVEVPAIGTAVVDGVVQRSGTNQALNDFSMTFVRADGTWKIASATESPLPITFGAGAGPGPTLGQLDWFVGKWQAKNGGREVELVADYTPRKNFITCKYTFNTGKQTETETQVIGWNPQARAPKSWLFTAAGGYSTGDWVKVNDNTWQVISSAMQPDGTVFSAKNIITVQGPNSFKWQSTERMLNGMLLPDSDPVSVERVSK